ncbi:MAG: hypothetical protein HW406_2535, partial [Candidatus Brocadiaceae bacterium]|nr:hypothetical protein [Candidatus Brocadiaceae bacterium]
GFLFGKDEGIKVNSSPQRRRGRKEKPKAIKIWDEKTRTRGRGLIASISYPFLTTQGL